MKEASGLARKATAAAMSSAAPKRVSGICGKGGLADIFVQHRGHVSLDETWCDDICGDVSAGKFSGKRLGEPDETGLARGIVCLPSEANQATHRADIDDSALALLDHGSQNGSRKIESALEVGVQHDVPIFRAHAQDQSVTGDARIIDEHITAAEIGQDGFTGFLDRIEIGDIDGVGFGHIGATAPIASAVFRALASVRLTTAMRAPSSASRRAIASPIPRPAPVTIAT